MGEFAKLLAIILVGACAQGISGRYLMQTSCLTLAGPLQNGVCNALLGQQSVLSNYSSQNVTDAQIQTYANSTAPPSSSCCQAMGGLVEADCQCESLVQSFAANYNVSPAQLILIARYAKIACGPQYIPANTTVNCTSTASG